jgi:hypothetical protein
MCILRKLHAFRWVLCLGLFAAAGGCSDSTPGPNANTDPENNPGVTQRNARQQAFGKQGLPVGKQAAKPEDKK